MEASVLQIGKRSLATSSWYRCGSEDGSMPITFHLGGRLTLGYSHTMQLSLLVDRHMRHLEDLASTNSCGLELGLTPFGWIRAGYLTESNRYPRKEFHGGFTLGYKARELYTFFQDRGRTIGVPRRFYNLHVLYTFALTDNRYTEHTARDGHQLHQLSCAFDLKTLPKRPKRERKAPRIKAVWDENELELID